MEDRFSQTAASMESPALHAFTITPDDSADLEEVTRAVYSGTGGDISMQMHSGRVVTFANVPEAVFLPVRVLRVLATNTTASSILGLV